MYIYAQWWMVDIVITEADDIIYSVDRNKTWMSVCCLTPHKQFFGYIMARTVYIQWNDGDARFILHQHAWLDFYSANSLKQQSAGSHLAPLGHIILISLNLSLLLLQKAGCLAETQRIPKWCKLYFKKK